MGIRGQGQEDPTPVNFVLVPLQKSAPFEELDPPGD
jgi:hypothetical protein